MKKVIAAGVLALLAGTAFAAETEVFNWRSRRGHNVYSDTPNQMQMGRSNVSNIRTGTVIPPTPKATPMENMSPTEQQAIANQRIAEQNRKIEEENAKREQEAKTQNCNAARMNLDTVQKSNARNKDQLIPRYQADINKYCNESPR